MVGDPDLDDPKALDKIAGDAVASEKLQQRGPDGEELSYAPNSQIPYTGWVKSMYENGQVKTLTHCKDGKPDGLWTWWHENGQKSWEQTYKDGKWDGLVTEWYENGQKRSEANWKDGKLWTVVVWKPNGEKCPVTKIDKDGNGVEVYYNLDGKESSRYTWRNGEMVSD